jgi:hypothetical protein
MVTAAKDFEVSSTSEGGANADNQFAGRRAGDWHVFNPNVLSAVQYRGLHGSLTQLARGLDGIAADLNDLLNGAPANVEDFLDGIAADLEHISNGTAANLDDILDRRAAAFHRVWHRFLHERLRKCSLVGSVGRLQRLRGPIKESAKGRKQKSGKGAIRSITLLLHRKGAQS